MTHLNLKCSITGQLGVTRYSQGCRCNSCRKAKKEYVHKYCRENKERLAVDHNHKTGEFVGYCAGYVIGA